MIKHTHNGRRRHIYKHTAICRNTSKQIPAELKRDFDLEGRKNLEKAHR